MSPKMPRVGVEPTRPEGHGLLRPKRLPVPPPRPSGRREPESHRCTRFCRPLPNCSAIAPILRRTPRLRSSFAQDNHSASGEQARLKAERVEPLGHRAKRVPNLSKNARPVESNFRRFFSSSRSGNARRDAPYPIKTRLSSCHQTATGFASPSAPKSPQVSFA